MTDENTIIGGYEWWVYCPRCNYRLESMGYTAEIGRSATENTTFECPDNEYGCGHTFSLRDLLNEPGAKSEDDAQHGDNQ